MEINTSSLYLEWALGDLLQEFLVRLGPGGGTMIFFNTLYVLYLFIVVRLGVPLLHMKKLIPRLRFFKFNLARSMC